MSLKFHALGLGVAISLLLVPIKGFSAVDYKHCQEKLMDDIGINYSLLKFDSSGKLSIDSKVLAMEPDVSFKPKTNVFSFEYKDVWGGIHRRSVKVDSAGVPTLDISDDVTDHQKLETTFAVKNDVCFPVSTSYTDYTPGRLEKSLRFHTEMCKELISYFEKNRKALICQCGDTSTNKAVANIIHKYDSSYDSSKGKGSVDFNQAVDPTSMKAVLAALSTPLSYSSAMIEGCNDEKTVVESLADKRIWGSSTNADQSGFASPAQTLAE
jgi:hypothetical protein